MIDSQGYYSLVQYSEYPERVEFVNIGVVVFSGVPPHVVTKFSRNSRRIDKVFQVHLGAHFEYLKESFESRLKVEFASGWSLENVQRFIGLRAGKIRLSPANSLYVEDPVHIADDLFDKLVGDPPPVKRRGPHAATKWKSVQSSGNP